MLTTDEDFDLKFAIQDTENFSKNNFNISNFLLKPLKPLPKDSADLNIVDPEYEQFLADVWVGIVLTLMVLSCVCFMCTCLIYHKFQQWKSRVLEARNHANVEANVVETDLPSYTIASGLPTYEEALEQLKTVKNTINAKRTLDSEWTPHTPPTPQITTLSVVNLFPFINNKENV